MENFTPISALIGGSLIGLSAVFLMATSGRVAGISGIIGGLFSGNQAESDRLWRLSFVAGLMTVPLIVILTIPSTNIVQFKLTGWPLIIAGIVVGLGTQLGNGCTSGHGVCGTARLSERSIMATVTFMMTGIVTVFTAKYLGLYL